MQSQQAEAASPATHIAAYSIFANLGPNTRAQVRCYEPGTPLFAALTREFPGDFARWEFHPVGGEHEEGLFKIKNVGLAGFVALGEDCALVVALDGTDSVVFRVQPGEDGSVLLSHSTDSKKACGVQGDGIRVNIVLQAADGSSRQKFAQVAIDPED